MKIDIPGWKRLELSHLVLDLNGTLSTDGILLAGVEERLRVLSERLSVLILTADTRGKGESISQQLGVPWRKLQGSLPEPEEKEAVARELGADRVAAVGNGRNDRLMLGSAAVGIAVLGQEGLATSALSAADIVTRDICDALDLLVYPKRLVASLRC